MWDVALPSGKCDEEVFAGLRVKPVERKFLIERPDTESVLISGTKKRVGAGGIERLGLTPEQLDAALAFGKEKYKNKNFPDSVYRAFRARPLLLLYLVRGYTEVGAEEIRVEYRPLEPPIAALGLSFPNFEDNEIAKHVQYSVNLIQWRSMLESETDDDAPEENDDVA